MEQGGGLKSLQPVQSFTHINLRSVQYTYKQEAGYPELDSRSWIYINCEKLFTFWKKAQDSGTWFT
jgi:hypothetical protein